MYNNYTNVNDTYQSCSVIIPSSQAGGSLLIGDFNSATNNQIIKKYNIKTIITAASGMEHLQVPSNVTHITYELLDAKSENIRKFFDQSSQAIKTNLIKGSVLVHCAAGISRSTTLVLAYLMKSRKIGFKEAISIARSKRKNVCPNLGFQRQLKKYEKQLKERGCQRINILKKTTSQKLSDQVIRTSYNSSHRINKSSNINQCFKFEPRTAGQSVRRRNQTGRRVLIGHSNSRPRQRKNFHVRMLNKDSLMVLGFSNKQSGSLSEKINPPIIQNYRQNAINNNWDKMKKFRLEN